MRVRARACAIAFVRTDGIRSRDRDTAGILLFARTLGGRQNVKPPRLVMAVVTGDHDIIHIITCTREYDKGDRVGGKYLITTKPCGNGLRVSFKITRQVTITAYHCMYLL